MIALNTERAADLIGLGTLVRWMAVRAAFNVLIAGVYVREARRGGGLGSRAGAVTVALLGLGDGAVAVALRSAERRPSTT